MNFKFFTHFIILIHCYEPLITTDFEVLLLQQHMLVKHNRYRCLRCFNFNCCQNCFLYKKTIDETQNENKKNNISNNKTIDKSDGGKVSSNGTRRSRHKITHPMQEYWTEVCGFYVQFEVFFHFLSYFSTASNCCDYV